MVLIDVLIVHMKVSTNFRYGQFAPLTFNIKV